MSALPQALVRMVPHGGTCTAEQLDTQMTYFTQKGKVKVQRSQRYQGITLQPEDFEEFARSWAMQTGIHQEDKEPDDGKRDLTTHMFVSFPAGTDPERAHAAGRAWVEHVFGSGENGDSFDYLTAFHTNRPHPHLHIILNRRSYEGNWLKISANHPQFGYQLLRGSFVDIAHEHGLHFEATTRAERGILERPITYAQYRRQAEQLIVIENDEAEETDGFAVPRRRKAEERVEDIDQRNPKRQRKEEPVAAAATSQTMPDSPQEGHTATAGPRMPLGEGSSAGNRQAPQRPQRRKADEDMENANPRAPKRRRTDDRPLPEPDRLDRRETEGAKDRGRAR